MLITQDAQPQTYRNAMAAYAGAVQIVTTDGAAGKRGVTAIAACSVSDDPPTVLVCLSRLNAQNDLFLKNGVFALNTLAAADIDVANTFSGFAGIPPENRFSTGQWSVLSSGAPVLETALAVFDCELLEAKEVATHRIYIGRVTGIRIGDKLPPLIYHERGYRILAD